MSRKYDGVTHCAVCGRILVETDGFLSCPVYLEGKNKKADEHTSYPLPDNGK